MNWEGWWSGVTEGGSSEDEEENGLEKTLKDSIISMSQII